MRTFHFAHRVVAATAGLEAGIVVSALACLLQYLCWNFEHYPGRLWNFLRL